GGGREMSTAHGRTERPPEGSRHLSASLSASFLSQASWMLEFMALKKEADKPTSIVVGFLLRAARPGTAPADVGHPGPATHGEIEPAAFRTGTGVPPI